MSEVAALVYAQLPRQLWPYQVLLEVIGYIDVPISCKITNGL